MAFTPKATFRAAAPGERMIAAYDMPFNGLQVAWEQAQQGAVSSVGLGTAFREGSIPRGNTALDMGGALPNPVATIGRLAQNIGGMIRGDKPQPSLTEEQYKASPYFRTEIPFEEGMTEDRAAALASFYDVRKVREYNADKGAMDGPFGFRIPHIAALTGGFAGQMLDPVNYIPVFGPGARVAAAARFGVVASRYGIGAAEGAINTAAFGMLTTDLRRQYGDDVSWQALVGEIAMSAVIGGVFEGALIPAAKAMYRRVVGDRSARGAMEEAKTLSDMKSIETQKIANAIFNEDVGGLVERGEIVRSPSSQAGVERIQAEVVERTAGRRALTAETANVAGDRPGEVVITPTGQRVAVRPEVVELADLLAATGDLQVRNRSTVSSDSWVEETALNLNPALLMPSIEADRGAPIIGPDNIVDSGNGRVMAIRRAAEAYPERYAEYRKALDDAGYATEGFTTPVLVSRRMTDLSHDARVQFNTDANLPATARMSAVEIAAMDRAALTDSVLRELDDGPVTSAGNRAFIARFLGNLSGNERGALVDSAGALNADGVRRVEAALVAAAYGDVDAGVLRRFAEATDDNTRSIVGAMADAAGRWAQMRRAVRAGDISPEFDPTVELTEALRLIGRWREEAASEGRAVSTVIREGMAQLDMLSGEIGPETQVFIRAFYKNDHFAQAAGRETIGTVLSRVVDAAAELGKPQLFGTPDVTKLEVLRNAAANEQGNLFTPASAGDGIEADGGFTRATEPAAGGIGQGRGQGAESLGGRAVADVMTERFAAAGRPTDEAAALGRLVDDFYAQQAARLGISVDDMVRRFGLPEVRQGGDGMFDPADDGLFDVAGEEAAINAAAYAQLAPITPEVQTASDRYALAMRREDEVGQKTPLAEWMARADERQAARDNLAEVLAASGERVVLTNGRGHGAFITRDSIGGKWRVTFFDERGFSGHRELPDQVRAIREALDDGYRTYSPDALREAMRGEQFTLNQSSRAVTRTSPAARAEAMRTVAASRNLLFQPGTAQQARGQIALGDQSIITLFETADASTALHETGHLFLGMFKGLADAADAPAAIKADWKAVRGWWSENADAVAADANASGRAADVTGDDVRAVLTSGTSGDKAKDLAIDVGFHEQWARGFEVYLREGKAPTEGLAKVFEQFKQWLTAIYQRAADLNITLSDDIRGVFDRMLGAQDALARKADAPSAPPRVPSVALLPTDTLDDVAARVGAPETVRGMAEQHGVNMVTGDYPESFDIDMLRAEGALSKEDLDELDAADTLFAQAEAYGNALKAAMTCIL